MVVGLQVMTAAVAFPMGECGQMGGPPTIAALELDVRLDRDSLLVPAVHGPIRAIYGPGIPPQTQTESYA